MKKLLVVTAKVFLVLGIPALIAIIPFFYAVHDLQKHCNGEKTWNGCKFHVEFLLSKAQSEGKCHTLPHKKEDEFVYDGVTYAMATTSCEVDPIFK